MSTLYFHNPGEIDIRGATIAGLSAKDSGQPIGFFGTGLKYAIACVLRWNGSITIHSGTKVYAFEAQDLRFRDKDFKQVCMSENLMSNIELGFTIEYGKKWKPWQVFRELYANALDEGGDVCESAVTPCAGQTVIVVRCKELIDPFHDRDNIILPRNHHFHHNGKTASITNKPSNAIFYRGVRVFENNYSATYNILKEMELTEDRTLSSRYSAHRCCSKEIQSCKDRDLIYVVATAAVTDGTAEQMFDWEAYDDHSTEFLDVVESLYRKHPTKFGRFKNILEQHRPASVALPELVPTRIQEQVLERCTAMLRVMGMPVDEHSVTLTDLGSNIAGMYHKPSRRIYISPEAFRNGTKYVLSTLYEEFIHAVTDKSDCTYDLQTYLFDKIIGLYEEHVFKEPI